MDASIAIQEQTQYIFPYFQGNNPSGLVVKKVPRLLGVGVFARRTFAVGTIVTRYMGETITLAEGELRDQLRRLVHP